MDIKLVLVVVTSLTALILAYLNFRLTREINRNSKNTELRTQAYVDFIDAVAESAMAGQSGKNRPDSITKKIVDAKTRIAIYGDLEVIQGLAEFDRDHGWAHDKESRDSLTRLVLAMRNTQVGRSKNDLKRDIRQVLFGN